MNRKVKLEEDIKVKTKTYTYMLPLLCRELNISSAVNLINIFVRHEDHPDKTNHLFCLFEWRSSKMHTALEEVLMNHKLCEFHEDVSSKHYMICFKVGDSFKKDYDLYIKGKYSKISEDSKKYILGFYRKDKDHVIGRILYKDPKYKKELEEYLNVKIDYDAELSSVLDINLETYKNSYVQEVMSPLPPLSRI